MISSRRPLRVLLAMVVGAAALLGGVPAMTDAAAAEPRPASLVGVYEAAPCAVEVSVEHRDRVRCGYLTVPERRDPGADPARTLRLPVAIVPSTSDEPADDPIIVPTGGDAGTSTLDLLPYFLDDARWATDTREVILVEQRGGPLAEPSLACPELDASRFIDDGALVTGAAADERTLTQLQACRDRLAEEGVDPAAYTSAASAADLADLRAALGLVGWNLYGLSYGSRVALTTMRDHPDGLRSVILDGAYPPQINRYESEPAAALGAIGALIARCEAGASCGDAYPELDTRLAEVLDRVAADPIQVTADSPVDGAPLRMTIDDTALFDGLVAELARPESARVLPFVIDRLARGDDDAVLPIVERQLAGLGARAAGLDLSIECGEEIPFNDDARIQAARDSDPLLAHFSSRPLLREECAIWAVPTLGQNEWWAVASGIPTLVTAGALDPYTPRTWADYAVEQLSQAHVVDLANMGQGAIRDAAFDGCAASIASTFLRDPATAPDAPCLGRATTTPFLTPADVHATSAFHRLDRDLIDDREPLALGVAGILILGLVASLGYGIVYGCAWLARRRGRAPDGAVLAASVAAGANLAYAAAVAWIVVASDPTALAFGIPSVAWPIMLLPLVAAAATVVLIVLLVRAWIGGDGTTGHRVALSFAALGSVLFLAWVLVRGLLVL